MKVLFATSQKHDDYLASCLWDGLQEVLGEENVFDAACNWNLHSGPNVIEGSTKETTRYISAYRRGKMAELGERYYDLLVLNACFRKDFDWHWVLTLLLSLKPGGKVAYVEGWDSAHEVHDPAIESNPPVKIDAYFRREIDPSFNYPYEPHHLTFAAPDSWFNLTSVAERPIDLIFCGIPHTECRRDCLVDLMRHSHDCHIVASTGKLPIQQYFWLLKQSKFALCPAGAAGSECLRTYEATACGAIPIFMDYPPWKRDNWFGPEHAMFGGDSLQVPDLVETSLQNGGTDKVREKMIRHAYKYHTTRYRAETLLKVLGL